MLPTAEQGLRSMYISACSHTQLIHFAADAHHGKPRPCTRQGNGRAIRTWHQRVSLTECQPQLSITPTLSTTKSMMPLAGIDRISAGEKPL